jgi:hypothetical protein
MSKKKKALYTKKPIPIEAEPWSPGLEDGWGVIGSDGSIHEIFSNEDVDLGLAKETETLVPLLKTLEGWQIIHFTDYILTGVQGERYPCKKDIFEETYVRTH